MGVYRPRPRCRANPRLTALPEHCIVMSETDQPVRVGLVGTGGIAKTHVLAWQRSPHAQVVGFADLERDKAQAFADTWQPDAVVRDSLEALLDATEVDLIDICTKEPAHPKVALPALQAGRHVLCEKIMADTLESGAAMADAAAKQPHLFAGVQYNYRFFPQMRMLIDLAHRQTRGKLRLLHVNAATQCFNHMLDSLLLMGGGEPMRVNAMGGTASASEQLGVDDRIAYLPRPAFSAQLEFESELVAVINATAAPNPPFKAMPFQITAMFDEGVLEVSSLSWPNQLVGTCRWLPDGDNLLRPADYPDPSNQPLSFDPALDAVAQAVRGQTPDPKPATFADGWRNMRVSHAMVRSNAQRCAIEPTALPGLETPKHSS